MRFGAVKVSIVHLLLELGVVCLLPLCKLYLLFLLSRVSVDFHLLPRLSSAFVPVLLQLASYLAGKFLDEMLLECVSVFDPVLLYVLVD